MNYKIEGILVLLNKDCILERYYPLIPYKDVIVKKLKDNGINYKEEAMNADTLLDSIFHNSNLTLLFKRFLNMYGINNTKLKEIDKLVLNDDEKKSFKDYIYFLELKRLEVGYIIYLV